MKEQEPIGLTTKPVDSTLEVRGDIFMPEPGNGEDQPKKIPHGENGTSPRKINPEYKERLRDFLASKPGEDARFDERKTWEMGRDLLMEKAGILPIQGAEDIRKFKPSKEEQEVPEGLALPEGATVRMDMETGKNYVRWDNPPDVEIEYRVTPEEAMGEHEDTEETPEAPAQGGEGGNGGDEKPPAPPAGETPEEPEEKGQREQEKPKDSHSEEALSDDAKEWLQREQEASRKRLELANSNYRKWLASQGVPTELVDELAKEAYKKSLAKTYDVLKTMAQGGELRPIAIPESLEELAKLVMNAASPEWREDGEKPLVKEDGTVNTVSFLDWARHNMLEVHNNNPTDPVNFFSDIGTSVRTELYAGTVSFYEITFGKNFFLQEDKEKGHPIINKDYKALHDQILYETFLLMLLRNPDITYRANRAVEKEMFAALSDAVLKNPLTRGNFFEFIFSMPSTYRKSILDVASDAEKKLVLEEDVEEKLDLRAKQEGNFFVGTAAREALATYMRVFSYEQLVKILGKDSALLTKKKDENGNLIEDGRKMEWFNQDGSTKLYKRNRLTRKWEESTDGTGSAHPDYMRYLNFFLSPNPLQTQVAEVRQLIRESIKERNKISDKEAELAELFAYSMIHTNGVAGRMDLDSVAFDWWTRLTNFRDKRKREKAEKRSGKYGSKYNLEGLKRIGLTFFEGARDARGRSIQSIILGGTGDKIDIEGNPIKNKVDYQRERVGEDDLIIFFNPQTGEKVDGLYAKDYELYEETKTVEGKEMTETKVKYKDADGQTVDVGKNIAKVDKRRIDTPIEFKADLQKSSVPVHLMQAAGAYDWIMDNVQFHFPEMVTGYDTWGKPIIEWDKVNKVKDGIMHYLRYTYSTWGEINFDEEVLEWEKIEVRNDKGRLIAKKKAKDGSDLELDEDWYILDKKGNKTDARNEPETYLDSRVMTRLESMFGVDALRYIQFEIEKRGLAAKQEGKVKTITDERGNQVEVDFSKASDDEFKIAVWRGTFDYLIAAEIAAHRDRGSGYRWYDSGDIKRTADVLTVGEMATPDQIKKIRKETGSRARWTYSQDIGYAFAVGGMEGFWKVFQITLKDITSGK